MKVDALKSKKIIADYKNGMYVSDISQFNVSTSALLKKGAKVVVGKMAVNTNGNIWVFIDKYGAWICVYDYGADVSKI